MTCDHAGRSRTSPENTESIVKTLLIVIANLLGVGALVVIMILSVEHSPYSSSVGVTIALLIGVAMLLVSVGLPAYNWWVDRQTRSHGDGGAVS